MQKENGDHNLKIKNTFNLKGISNFIMDLENYFKNGKVYVWKETFAIIKAKKEKIRGLTVSDPKGIS